MTSAYGIVIRAMPFHCFGSGCQVHHRFRLQVVVEDKSIYMSVIMVYNRYITWLNPNLKFGIQEFSGSCIRPVRAPVKRVAGKAGGFVL